LRIEGAEGEREGAEQVIYHRGRAQPAEGGVGVWAYRRTWNAEM
jgi:hypothetical protein